MAEIQEYIPRSTRIACPATFRLAEGMVSKHRPLPPGPICIAEGWESHTFSVSAHLGTWAVRQLALLNSIVIFCYRYKAEKVLGRGVWRLKLQFPAEFGYQLSNF